jgi:hypothetical protein
MQIVQKKGEPSPNNLAWGTADSWGRYFCSCRSEAADGRPELRETKAHSMCVVTAGSLCVSVCVCVCVRARERETDRKRETAPGTPRYNLGVDGDWILGSRPLAFLRRRHTARLPMTLGLAVWVTVTEVLQSGMNYTRDAMWLCAWPSARERNLCCVTQKFEWLRNCHEMHTQL